MFHMDFVRFKYTTYAIVSAMCLRFYISEGGYYSTILFEFFFSFSCCRRYLCSFASYSSLMASLLLLLLLFSLHFFLHHFDLCGFVNSFHPSVNIIILTNKLFDKKKIPHKMPFNTNKFSCDRDLRNYKPTEMTFNIINDIMT